MMCLLQHLTCAVRRRGIPHFQVHNISLDGIVDSMDSFLKAGAANPKLHMVFDVQFQDKLRFPLTGGAGINIARAIERVEKVLTWFYIIVCEYILHGGRRYNVYLEKSNTSVELAIQSCEPLVAVSFRFPHGETLDGLAVTAMDSKVREAFCQPKNEFWRNHSRELCRRTLRMVRGEAKDLHGDEFLG